MATHMKRPAKFATAIAAAIVLAGCAHTAARNTIGTHPLTLDTHVDIPSAYMDEPRFDAGTDSVLKVDLGKLERGGLDAVFFIVYVDQGPLTPQGYATAVASAERKYAAIERLTQRYPQRIRFAKSPDDVRANQANGLLSAMIGIENAYSLGHDLARVDAAYARGARYLGLVHIGNNDLCTSSMPDVEHGEPPPGDVGISEFGRAVVRRANALGIMVDVSHASDACVRDTVAASTAPVIASHSASRALVDHARNLDDDLVRAIAAKGGVIQTVAFRTYVKHDPGRTAAEKALKAQIAAAAGDAEFDDEKHGYTPAFDAGMERIAEQFPLATLDDFLDHVQHFVDVAGIDHVGIASDFDGGGGVTGWIDASETANVTAGLRRRGFSDGDIEKIWSGNLLRVWRRVEGVAAAR
jgi:membrane dipeptidase